MRSFRRPHPIIAAAIVTAIAILGSASYGIICRYNLRANVDSTQKRLKDVATGIASLFVDDCNGMEPDPHNYLPLKLTTPVAYVKERYVDGFSPKGEPLRYVNQANASNGTEFLVVSCGPDGDWDIDRLPLRHKLAQPVRPPDGSTIYMYDRDTTFSDLRGQASWGGWVNKVCYYTTVNGKRVDVPMIEVMIIPRDSPNYWLSRDQLIEYLAKSNIAFYDPTNGLRSDGDIIYANCPR